MRVYDDTLEPEIVVLRYPIPAHPHTARTRQCTRTPHCLYIVAAAFSNSVAGCTADELRPISREQSLHLRLGGQRGGGVALPPTERDAKVEHAVVTRLHEASLHRRPAHIRRLRRLPLGPLQEQVAQVIGHVLVQLEPRRR
eukprot:scaffold47789_cov63-Phaeocystis_antarctica.AAC.2